MGYRGNYGMEALSTLTPHLSTSPQMTCSLHLVMSLPAVPIGVLHKVHSRGQNESWQLLFSQINLFLQ